jgi:phosphatidylinositol alpha-1,6-mannosyltransferase
MILTAHQSPLDSVASEIRSNGYSRLVLSEIFPPTKGGSGKWLSEIYARLTSSGTLMVVGRKHIGADECTEDRNYPHPILREDLSMAFRGVAQVASLRAYYRITHRIRALAQSYRVASIHAARPLFEGLVARLVKATMGLPYLCFIHGEDINVAKTSRELSFLTNSVLKNADRLIANSGFTRELLIHDWNVPTERIELMHPGVDCNYYAPLVAPSPRSLFPESRHVLLTVGRLQERKGHDSLIGGLQEIRKLFPNVLYAIAGDGEQKLVLKELVDRLNLENHVRFLGEVDDATLRQAYRECDLFVLPNRAVGRDMEGFGIVLLEAQACGKPVIAGRSGGTKDAIIPNQTGLLVDCENPRQPQDLVSGICRLLADERERQRLGTNARTFVRNSFDWEILAQQAEKALSLPTAQLS